MGDADKNAKAGERKPRKYVRKLAKPQDDIVDVEGDEEDEEDEDEACLARPCKRPASEEVDWVQCDTCEQWYHNLCVGITAKKATELDSYICPYCSAPSSNIQNEGSLEPASTAASPDSNIDVVSTTPCATTPSSPRSPTVKANMGNDLKLEEPMPEVTAACSVSSA